MSGPKSYSLPPRYSAGVFDGKLHTIFDLQARMQSLRDELAQELVATFSIIPTNTFGQKEYDCLSRPGWLDLILGILILQTAHQKT